MNRAFTPISLAEKDRYYNIWAQTPVHSLDYTFANLWGWQEFYGLEWCFDEQICWIRQTKPELLYWAPLGPWPQIDWAKVIDEVITKEKFSFTRAPVELAMLVAEALPNNASLEEERGQWEYLYLQSDLANLAGKKFHKKKNHFNSYVKSYGEPDYRVIDQNNVAEVLALQHLWCQWHECDDSPSLRAENTAIERVLTHWGQFRNMYGGCLYVDNKMIAFSVGEKLDEQMLGVHFEKGLGEYKGVYQAINHEFAIHAGAGFKWINRAQDLDEEGLRQAKMTYMPEGFLKKVLINFTKRL